MVPEALRSHRRNGTIRWRANSIFGSAAATLEYARQALMRESIFLIVAIGGIVMPVGLALRAAVQDLTPPTKTASEARHTYRGCL
jgi:hypothetical protein